MNLTEQLIHGLAGKFDADEYQDEFSTKVMDLIQRKAAGEEVELPKAEEEVEPTQTRDLADVLKEGLRQLKHGKRGARHLRRGDELHTFPAERAKSESSAHSRSKGKGRSKRKLKMEDVLEPGRSIRGEDLPM